MFFVATRDLAISLLLTILYIIVIDGLLHEKRKFCIIPKEFMSKINNNNKNAEQQYLQAKQVVLAYEAQTKEPVEAVQAGETINATQPTQPTLKVIPVQAVKPIPAYETYVNNVTLLNKI